MISVIVPTCKRPRQLRESLASLARQDLTLVHEVLIGDDSPAELQDENRSVIADSGLFSHVSYLRNDPPKGNYPNQWSLADRATAPYILILHDDDRLTEGTLATLLAAAKAETDPEVKLWFGRHLITDEAGVIDHALSKDSMARGGKAGPSAVKPMWQWCLSAALPPNSFLIDADLYKNTMRGPRDGNVGDFALSVRLANKGIRARFLAEDLLLYRSQHNSVSRAGRGIDVHYIYESAQTLEVPAEWSEQKRHLLALFARVATVRYVRDGERALAWQCYRSNAWNWRQRLSPRGIATLAMLLTPRFVWWWALTYK